MEDTKIENIVQELANIQSQCQELIDRIREIEKENKQNEPKFERVLKNEDYYTLMINPFGAIIDRTYEKYNWIDNVRCINNNYFKTYERAQEVADKINFLLKLERLHDIFCPDFVPNFNDFNILKYTIYRDHSNKIYRAIACYSSEHRTQVFFPSGEIAQKVCDILNKELEQGENK